MSQAVCGEGIGSMVYMCVRKHIGLYECISFCVYGQGRQTEGGCPLWVRLAAGDGQLGADVWTPDYMV